jgi:DNA polymerase
MDPRAHAEQPYRRWLPRALRCLAQRREPAVVAWSADGQPEQSLFGIDGSTGAAPLLTPSAAFRARAVHIACHRDPKRWDLLYRVLWRVHVGGEKHLLHRCGEPDVRRFETYHRAVTMDAHRMKGFLRFEQLPDENAGAVQLVAYYEPDHRVLGWVVPHFRKRMGQTPWAILTPDASVTCHEGRYHFGPGARMSASEDGDDIARLWCRFYEAAFNPARSNTPLLDKNLPKRYRKHLTEATTIETLSRDGRRSGGRSS